MIKLKRNADRRVRRGHLWIFSNEIESPPVAQLEPGAVHEVRDATGEFVGMAYVNPQSLITARILSRRKIPIDRSFLETRIHTAVEFRRRMFPYGAPCRLIFSESDLLPGLIVDRYAEYLAVQSHTAGMDSLLPGVLEILHEAMSPAGIYLRNDSPIRELEGTALEKRLVSGSVPARVTIRSHGLKFLVDIQEGQKTGFFLDQEANRDLMGKYAFSGARVLDLFCYTGAWGIHAAATGASEVVAVDSSRGALHIAESNSEINGAASRFYTVREQAVDFLKKTDESWDLIVADPPAFIKSRSKVNEGRKGYIDLNRRAMGRLKVGGILVTCSCSRHLSFEDFEEVIRTASHQAGKRMRILETRGQGPDHPVLLSMPETRYLKVIVAQAI
ncbi:MAG: class I SAM-dependent rRNA methyltransferase [Desulfomonilaceae bacterium]|nr:class I SAM-dependent rRNA methyltransferase [Desulfomonilaceae bacterium]